MCLLAIASHTIFLMESWAGSVCTINRRHFIAGAAFLGSEWVVPTRHQSVPPTPPFRLPFADPPALDTWFITQWYGNTAFAYRMRHTFYQSGQGLHFGIDFATPCHTPILAIGAGEVWEIDGTRRAWPNHVVVKHIEDVFSLYGHLSAPTHLQVGDAVAPGDLIGLSGDSQTHACNGAPHLHLEIRCDGMLTATNPVNWIAADWPTLTLGISEIPFQVDLANPDRWQSLYDQPDIRFWHPPLNAYHRTWPPT